MNTQLQQLAQASPIHRFLTGDVARATPSTETSVLPEPVALAGNAVTQLAMLMTQVDQQDQKNASAAQDAADQAIEQSDAQHVQDLRAKAGADEGAAWAGGLGEIAGGSLSLGGALSESTDVAARHAGAARWDALGKVAPGLGTIASGRYKAAGDTDDANAAADKSASDAAQRRYDQAKSEAQSAADSIQKVEQYLQTVLQTQEATNLKAAGGPG